MTEKTNPRFDERFIFGGVLEILETDDYPLMPTDTGMCARSPGCRSMRITEASRVSGKRIPYVADMHWILVPDVGIFFRDGHTLFYDPRPRTDDPEDVDLAESFRYIMDSRCYTVASESKERERVVIGEFGPGEREVVFPESFLGGPEVVERIREALSSYGMVGIFIVSPQLAERHRD